MTKTSRPSVRGFASMTLERLKEVSSKGGKKPRKGPTGFAALTPERRAEVSAMGGQKSRRPKKKTNGSNS